MGRQLVIGLLWASLGINAVAALIVLLLEHSAAGLLTNVLWGVINAAQLYLEYQAPDDPPEDDDDPPEDDDDPGILVPAGR